MIKIKNYANWRGDKVKNAGAIASLFGFPIGQLYAIVADDGGVVLALKKGIYTQLLRFSLLNYLNSLPGSKKYFWNNQDSIYDSR